MKTTYLRPDYFNLTTQARLLYLSRTASDRAQALKTEFGGQDPAKLVLTQGDIEVLRIIEFFEDKTNGDIWNRGNDIGSGWENANLRFRLRQGSTILKEVTNFNTEGEFNAYGQAEWQFDLSRSVDFYNDVKGKTITAYGQYRGVEKKVIATFVDTDAPETTPMVLEDGAESIKISITSSTSKLIGMIIAGAAFEASKYFSNAPKNAYVDGFFIKAEEIANVPPPETNIDLLDITEDAKGADVDWRDRGREFTLDLSDLETNNEKALATIELIGNTDEAETLAIIETDLIKAVR